MEVIRGDEEDGTEIEEREQVEEVQEWEEEE